MEYNQEKIIEVILACEVSPTARETAMPLVEAWIEKWGEFDTSMETLHVESPFYMWLDEKTLVLGVVDRIARDEVNIYGCEWKTHKEPRQKKDGTDYANENEDRWLEDMNRGAQVPLYAMALNRGTFVNKDGSTFKLNVNAPVPMIVRAAIKSVTPRWWPTKVSSGLFEISAERMLAVANSFINRAEQIRSTRKTGLLPWQLTGNQCFAWFRECEFFKQCSGFDYIASAPASLINPGNPGAAALGPALAEKGMSETDALFDKNFVVLSYSGYTLGSQCMEKFRIIDGNIGSEETSLPLEIGSACHIGWAAYYEQFIGKGGSK